MIGSPHYRVPPKRLVFWRFSKQQGHSRCRVTICYVRVGSVQHQDACVMVTPTGECMLVDAGAATETWNAGRNAVVPFLRSRGVRCIDRAVISHGDNDHWGGLAEVASGVRIKEVVLPRGVPIGGLADMIPDLIDRGVEVTWAAAGDTLEPLGGLECSVLHPSAEFEREWGEEMGGDLNERSLVLRVKYGDAVFLLAGDVEQMAEHWLVERGAPLKCAILKVPHHGSDTSSGEEFIKRASPLVAVISCGPRKLFNLPKPSVLDRYGSLGSTWLLTACDGAVIVCTDGKSIDARSFVVPERCLNDNPVSRSR